MKYYSLTKEEKSDIVGLYLACGYTTHGHNYKVVFNIPEDKKQKALEVLKPFSVYAHPSDTFDNVNKVCVTSKWLHSLLNPLGNCRKFHRGGGYLSRLRVSPKKVLKMYVTIRGGIHRRKDGKYMLRLGSKNENLAKSLSYLINKTPLQKLNGKEVLKRDISTKYHGKEYNLTTYYVQSYYNCNPKTLIGR